MITLLKESMPDLFYRLVESSDFSSSFITPGHERELESRIVIMRTATRLDRKQILNYPELKFIIRAGTGYDNIDVNFAREQGIRISTTPGANAVSAFEHTLSFITAMIKQHQEAKKVVLNGSWRDKLTPNPEFADLKVLVVGVGRIGSRIARTLNWLGAEVKGVDPYLDHDEWVNRGLEPVSYEQGLGWCNLITYHCPLTWETLDYFRLSTLSRLRYPVWIVNTARGGIVNEQALRAGLESGQILGAALDVFRDEPVPVNTYPDHPRLYLTPHTGSMTQGAKKRLAEETFRVWSDFVVNGNVTNEIDYRFVIA